MGRWAFPGSHDLFTGDSWMWPGDRLTPPRSARLQPWRFRVLGPLTALEDRAGLTVLGDSNPEPLQGACCRTEEEAGSRDSLPGSHCPVSGSLSAPYCHSSCSRAGLSSQSWLKAWAPEARWDISKAFWYLYFNLHSPCMAWASTEQAYISMQAFY